MIIDVRTDLGVTPGHEDTQRAMDVLEHEMDAAIAGHDGSPEAQDRMQKAYTAWRAGLANSNSAAYEA